MISIKLNIRLVLLFLVALLSVQQGWMSCLMADDGQRPNGDIKIIIKETNLVKKSDVLLGDISEIQANGFLKEALENIVLGSSPKPDKVKSFDRKKIVSIIQSQRYLPDNMTITSPQRIYVKRLCQTILKQDVKKFVDTRLSQVFKQKEYQLASFNVRGLEPYPQGKTLFRMESNDMIDKKGKLSLFLDVIIDGLKEDRLSVTGEVKVYENVLHAKRSFAKGETLGKADVFLEKNNIFDLGDNFIKTFEEIDKKILTSSVRKGECLKTSLLAEPPLIHKGDIVTLVAKNDNLMIVTSGISIEDGFENGVIKVENLTSGKLVRGIVKTKSKVEVVY
ncbi:MAG: flagellar basal body P-ring formation chaperone FlgA [Proteobacteria bacterium]|nr:flagellar basal body P-ring formation chaperone FlgA [Pseudomonadota bacterium]MBU1581179.1 flagellar basal body P-ring formation chaperone FlgA [Pseudomonadota bacterium]MBU2629860.1 flagellar basal body P-ring formation chaperone FlgA [Pseudomonadota bacterium]